MSYYVTLPSNSRKGDKLNDYRVHLPYALKMSGQWEVALVQIMYPHSWYNVDAENKQGTLTVSLQKSPEDDDVTLFGAHIPSNYYETALELTSAIKRALHELAAKHGMGDIGVRFRYDKVLKRIYHTFSTKVRDVWLNPQLLYMMGYDLEAFKPSTMYTYSADNHRLLYGEWQDGYYEANPQFGKTDFHKHVAENFPDISAGTTALYVYSDICADQVVGNVMAPLLRVVNIRGNNMETVDEIYHDQHYVPVLERDVSSIHIAIKGDGGDSIPFQSGRVILKLHFRKRMISR